MDFSFSSSSGRIANRSDSIFGPRKRNFFSKRLEKMPAIAKRIDGKESHNRLRRSSLIHASPPRPSRGARRWRIPVRIPGLKKPPQLVRWDLLGVFLSFLWGSINGLVLPSFLRVWVYKGWAYAFKANLDEVIEPLESFPCLKDFFSRSIDLTKRPITEEGMASPVDARVVVCGEVTEDRVREVKGISYSISGFLGREFSKIRRKSANSKLYHCVLYLAPGDYHRIHSSDDWKVSSRRHFPGTLFPIMPTVGRLIPNLLALNERVALLGERNDGSFYSLTAVGAYNVGSMSFKFDSEIRTNSIRRDFRNPNLQYFSMGGVGSYAYRMEYPNEIPVKKGEEIGLFNLGSTVVLIFESENFEFTVQSGDKVKLGQLLGREIQME
eukprot:TRINITY_DN1471_c0_g1_i1.p1 TRINITY_DN1471_c0_g1~~TRINITY_DN1471_c0_g1_i1.p1  ORF type:complete len:382 (+),score=140.55 TRINITY_DN1471_c0_g1_i1:92-1237(+)